MTDIAAIASLIKRGDFAAAREAGHEALARTGDMPELLYLTAVAEVRLGRAEAGQALARRLLQDGGRLDLVLDLVRTLIRQQALTVAGALCREVLHAKPDDADARALMAHIEAAASPYQGYLEAVKGRTVVGWCWKVGSPGETVTVEVLDGETVVASGQAGHYREDLEAGGIGDGRHGFRIALPADLLDGREHRISVRGSGTSVPLANGAIAVTLSDDLAAASAEDFQGFFDGLVGRRVEGWVYRPDQPGVPVPVVIAVDGVDVAEGVADRYRADLAQAGCGTGHCAFSIELPPQVLDGRTHEVMARVAGTSVVLASSTPTITPAAASDAPAAPTGEWTADYQALSLQVARLQQDLAKATDALRTLTTRAMPQAQLMSAGPQDRKGGVTAPSDLLEAARQARSGLDDYIVFPIIEWGFRFQRPQHFATTLARQGHRVFYVSMEFLPETAATDFVIRDMPEPGVFIVALRCPAPHPVIYSDPFTSTQVAALSQALGSMRDVLRMVSPVALVQFPMWRPVAGAVPGAVVVFDCLDHFAGFGNVAAAALAEEQRLLLEADLVTASSAGLAEIVGRDRDALLIRNAADHGFFSTPPDRLMLMSDRPVVGYFGAIAEWFDVDLVADAARRHPEWMFVLIGSTDGCDTTLLRAQPNVHLLGEIPYEALKGYLYGFDVCIIPFKIIDLTRHTNPVKVYEYLSAGKPVVATPMPELAEIEADLVRLAETPAAFSAALEEAMAERGSAAKEAQRRDWAAGQTWQARVDVLRQGVAACRPRVSVVVLTYNNLSLTKACLDSVIRYTDYPGYELIIVDNASHDETPAYLQAFAERHPHVRLVLNDRNLGFSGGCNAGLEAATGDVLVLLNNDTFVTDGWLGDLVRHLRITPHLGLVGPVTNSIGNEAAISIAYRNMEEMAEQARLYTGSRARELLFVNRVAFFCVAIPRTVLDDVGLLSEDFGVGMFEDDDYCNRVRAAGYSIAIAEDVFVHHHHSASLDLLKQNEKAALFERNRAIYEKKWGPWQPHQSRGDAERSLWVPFNAP